MSNTTHALNQCQNANSTFQALCLTNWKSSCIWSRFSLISNEICKKLNYHSLRTFQKCRSHMLLNFCTDLTHTTKFLFDLTHTTKFLYDLTHTTKFAVSLYFNHSLWNKPLKLKIREQSVYFLKFELKTLLISNPFTLKSLSITKFITLQFICYFFGSTFKNNFTSTNNVLSC